MLTRAAPGQKTHGLAVDCRPSAALLDHMRPQKRPRRGRTRPRRGLNPSLQRLIALRRPFPRIATAPDGRLGSDDRSVVVVVNPASPPVMPSAVTATATMARLCSRGSRGQYETRHPGDAEPGDTENVGPDGAQSVEHDRCHHGQTTNQVGSHSSDNGSCHVITFILLEPDKANLDGSRSQQPPRVSRREHLID